MSVILVQHGEAIAREIDPDRPLSHQGKQDIDNLARQLVDAGITVNRILHSGKLRAEQTANILADKIHVKGQPEMISGINPNDTVEPLAQQLDKWSDNVMVVGHLPFLAKLVSYLILGITEPILVTYYPGTVVCLDHNDISGWQIQWMLRPDYLKK